jgi:hypothetical protein
LQKVQFLQQVLQLGPLEPALLRQVQLVVLLQLVPI